MSNWVWILVAAIAGSAYFAGAETAVLSSGRLRQRAHSEQRKPLAGLAERLYRRPEQTLAILLLGNNVVSIVASIAALMLTEQAFHKAGHSLPVVWSDLISSLWVTVLVLVLGEALPKSVARHYAVRLTRFAAPLLLGLRLLLQPLFWLMDGLAGLGRALFRRGSVRTPTVTWETVMLHLETGRAEGVFGEQDETLVQRIGQLNQLNAESLMIPLSELCVHPLAGSVGELRRKLGRARAFQAFLYEADPGLLVGLIPARRLLDLPADQPLAAISGRLRRVPWHRPLLELIDELQLAHSKFAVVTDFRGRSLGAVFLRDLLRRLVHFQEEWKIAENGSEES